MKNLILAITIATCVSSVALAQAGKEHEGHQPGAPTVQTSPQQTRPPATPVPQAPAGGNQKPAMGHMSHDMAGGQMKQMGEMMGIMRKMMPMMENLQKPNMTPAARAEMMKQMAPMMQQMMPMMQHMTGEMNGSVAAPAATNTHPHVRENMQAMDKMHGPMNTGVAASTADEAFVRGMIPHHQGAIDMAIIVLKYGKDDLVRKWANDVIREQQREITEMEAWLKMNSK